MQYWIYIYKTINMIIYLKYVRVVVENFTVSVYTEINPNATAIMESPVYL